MNYEQIIKGLTYKPGWTLTYQRGMFCHWLIISAQAPDARNPFEVITFHVQKMIPENAFDTPEEFINRWVKDIIIQIEMHEVREFLRYNGELVDDPHKTETVLPDESQG